MGYKHDLYDLYELEIQTCWVWSLKFQLFFFFGWLGHHEDSWIPEHWSVVKAAGCRSLTRRFQKRRLVHASRVIDNVRRKKHRKKKWWWWWWSSWSSWSWSSSSSSSQRSISTNTYSSFRLAVDFAKSQDPFHFFSLKCLAFGLQIRRIIVMRSWTPSNEMCGA